MTRLILAALLIATPAMAADITGIPRILDVNTVQIDATKGHRRAGESSILPRSRWRDVGLRCHGPR
jgi:hypothetical protein